MVGYLKGGLYSSNHLHRSSQWLFSENKDRSIWIDLCVSKEHVGRKMVKQFEQLLPKKVNGRQNIYVCSFHDTVPFYIKCGFHPIETPNHQKDEDNPHIFQYQIACWMAKPLGDRLDKEVELYPSTGKLTDEFQLMWALKCMDIDAFKRSFNFNFVYNDIESYFHDMKNIHDYYILK